MTGVAQFSGEKHIEGNFELCPNHASDFHFSLGESKNSSSEIVLDPLEMVAKMKPPSLRSVRIGIRLFVDCWVSG